MTSKDLAPVMAAHIYTVCPTAIPTVPTLIDNASEDEVMSGLGMIKDKNGQFETFEKFLTRTEVWSCCLLHRTDDLTRDRVLYLW